MRVMVAGLRKQADESGTTLVPFTYIVQLTAITPMDDQRKIEALRSCLESVGAIRVEIIRLDHPMTENDMV